MVIVMAVALVVNLLLLIASGKMALGAMSILRVFLAACLGALLTGMTMLPGLAHWLWRLGILLITGITAFGFCPRGWGSILLFVLLHLSLGGIAEQSVAPSMLLGAAGIGLACLILGKRQRLIPVELTYGGKTLHLTALRDTGNTLRDPVTGKCVMVVGADTAWQLTGLTDRQLREPLKTIAAVPGLRLIPYQSVGNSGFLLAVWIPKAKIGDRQGSAIVAMSPQVFGSHYQALTGGTV